MNILHRTDFTPDGIFGTFTFDGDDAPFGVTLEHAYQLDDAWVPKVPPGTYKCVLGQHYLHSGPVTTFEIMGVAGHSGILCCHVGNYNKDSDGCVLIGDAREGNMITNSRDAFERYMARLVGVDEFMLEVI